MKIWILQNPNTYAHTEEQRYNHPYTDVNYINKENYKYTIGSASNSCIQMNAHTDVEIRIHRYVYMHTHKLTVVTTYR